MQLLRAIGLDHREMGGGYTWQVHEADFGRFSGITPQAFILPAFGIIAAYGKAGVHTFDAFLALGGIHDFGAHVYGLFGIHEVNLCQLAGGNLAVHSADIANTFAIRRFGNLCRPFLKVRLTTGIVENLTAAVWDLFGGTAIDNAGVFIHFRELGKNLHVSLLYAKLLNHNGSLDAEAALRRHP
ncbi:MAG: hypothetical protein ACRESI_06605 [Gammaproteobacteria bacterium]